MKTVKFILLLSFFLIPSVIFGQTRWTGGGASDSFSDIGNWDNGVPMPGSVIIFDIGGDIYITNIPGTYNSTASISSMLVQNNTRVFFDNTTAGPTEFYVNNIEIEGGSSFIVEGTEQFSVFTETANIYGTLDAGDIHLFKTFGTGSGYNFIDAATFVTANINGVSGSIQGNYHHNNFFYLVYNGIDAQNTGLTGDTQPFGDIFINNGSADGVFMDENVSVDTLTLLNGNFNIVNKHLTVTGAVNYAGGSLSGDINSSVLEINTTNSLSEFLLETPLTLDSLIIQSDTTVFLTNTDVLSVSDLVMHNGNLAVADCELEVNNSFYRVSASAFLTGGTNAVLTFNNLTSTPSPLNTLQLGSFTNRSDRTVSLEGDLTVEISLSMENGILDIGNNTLIINGDYSYTNGLLSGNGISVISINETGGTAMNIAFNATANSISSLYINNPGGIIDIDSDLKINNQLDITGGKLRVNNILTFSPGAYITATETDYIITSEGAFVEVQGLTNGTNFFLPVGTNTFYAPVAINSISGADYSIAVYDNIYTEGNFGTPVNDKNVNLRWEIYPAVTSDFDLTLSWDPNAESGSFDLSQCYISNYDGYQWDNIGLTPGTSSATVNSQTRSVSGLSGFFGVFYGINNLPTAADNTVIALVDIPYIFTLPDFNFYDADGDNLEKIEITQMPQSGMLFLDGNSNDVPDAVELIAAGSQIMYYDIEAGNLKFIPATGEFGIPYTNFLFRVSDGLSYSASEYSMNINVGNNRPPVANDQTFVIPEHSPNGTFVGKIEAADPDAGQTLFFYPAQGAVFSDAFKIESNGTITVNNSDLLEYSINPAFSCDLDVCDDGEPVLCTPITVTVNLEEVIQDLVPANYISPNGDGYNDTWIVKGLENGTFEAFIFNNNGKELFYSPEYKNDWDGTNYGKELPPGIYYYLLKSGNIELKGTITLVR